MILFPWRCRTRVLCISNQQCRTNTKQSVVRWHEHGNGSLRPAPCECFDSCMRLGLTGQLTSRCWVEENEGGAVMIWPVHTAAHKQGLSGEEWVRQKVTILIGHTVSRSWPQRSPPSLFLAKTYIPTTHGKCDIRATPAYLPQFFRPLEKWRLKSGKAGRRMSLLGIEPALIYRHQAVVWLVIHLSIHLVSFSVSCVDSYSFIHSFNSFIHLVSSPVHLVSLFIHQVRQLLIYLVSKLCSWLVTQKQSSSRRNKTSFYGDTKTRGGVKGGYRWEELRWDKLGGGGGGGVEKVGRNMWGWTP